jgi:ABC-2 type transport system permease protein
MAVYKRTYTPYHGDLTPEWSRFLILPRASWAKFGQSKLLMSLRMASLIYPLGCILYVYLANNLSVLQSLGLPAGQYLNVDRTMFLYFCWIQGAFAYVMTALVGPSLVSPDLVNNALPLYLCRPFSRTEYVLGKMSVLVGLLSIATWVPGLVVFGVQASLAGWDWTKANAWMAGSLFVGLLLWVVLLSLIALAISAWVKWRIAAGALLLGIFVAGAGFGSALNQIVRTQYGSLLNLTQVMYTIWSELFGLAPDTGLTVEEAWGVVAVVCAGCVWLLGKKIRAFEVVK